MNTQSLLALRTQIQRCVVGQEEAIDQVLACLLAGGHALLEGVPGLGKTLLVKALARAIGGQSARIQFTPDLMPADVSGHAVLDLRDQGFQLRKGPVFTNLLLADEINRAPAKTQSALLEAMQEQQVTIEGESYALPQPFLVLATQNPLDQEGTYPLPEAQLDRFLVKVRMGFPTAQEELELLLRATTDRVGDGLDVTAVEAVLDPVQVLELQRECAGLAMNPALGEYAVSLARATRDWPGLSQGAGPRGSIALVRMGRALAVLDGRDYVIPDDIQAAALPVLRHRVRLSTEAELEGLEVEALLEGLLAQVPAPRA